MSPAKWAEAIERCLCRDTECALMTKQNIKRMLWKEICLENTMRSTLLNDYGEMISDDQGTVF